MSGLVLFFILLLFFGLGGVLGYAVGLQKAEQMIDRFLE